MFKPDVTLNAIALTVSIPFQQGRNAALFLANRSLFQGKQQILLKPT